MGRRLVALRAPFVAALVLALSATGVLVPAATAQQSDRASELQAQIGEASAQEAAALAQLQAIRDKKAGIDARVRDLDNQVSAAEAKLRPLEAEAERLAVVLAAAEADLARAEAKLARAQAKLDHSAAQMYLSARSGSTYDRTFSAPPAEMVRGDRYLDNLSAERDQVLRRVRRLRNHVHDVREAIKAQKAEADRVEAQAQTERDNVATLRAEIEPVRAEAAQQEQAESALVADIQAKKAQYEAEYNALQAASDAISEMLRQRGTGPGASGKCQARPVPGSIGSGFGMRYHPILHYSRMHTGADMHAGAGEPIHACRAGTVVSAGWQGGYGNAVIIDHGGGMATLYGHQSSIAVSTGQHVEAGQVIGYVGSTGMATGPHLHFEVRLGGNPVDPAPYL